jgi:hypothetical protein
MKTIVFQDESETEDEEEEEEESENELLESEVDRILLYEVEYE